MTISGVCKVDRRCGQYRSDNFQKQIRWHLVTQFYNIGSVLRAKPPFFYVNFAPAFAKILVMICRLICFIESLYTQVHKHTHTHKHKHTNMYIYITNKKRYESIFLASKTNLVINFANDDQMSKLFENN